MPEGTPKEKTTKQMPDVEQRLLAKVAKEHPDVRMRDVRFYSMRFYSFGMKLGEESHSSNMPCMIRIR